MQLGILYAAAAYFLWGLFPLYFKQLQSVGALEIVLHRIMWSAVFLYVILAFRRQWAWLAALRQQPRVVLRFLASSAALSLNWWVYIWAVNNGHVVDGSLGYFINPLINVLLGYLVLKERLRRGQWGAIALAALGVLWLTYDAGQLPWIGLVLALSFGTYGLMRKTASLGALEGLSLETLLLAPFALAYWAWLIQQGQSDAVSAPLSTQGWLLLAGPITAIPLLLFAAGARRIPLSLLGLLQYIGPTLQLLLGVYLYNEPLEGHKLWGYGLIWLALLVYSAEGLFNNRQARQIASR
ncbi:EamA family transporter RarD [Parvibium lacunae]|uniref:EamA family transporter RarD n=1 Tax=Parvibium lacunae TaxID=1888893 RepID=A0A368L3N2_9BURK|nr:EamA family transporter RarD [Parvibium lacunae]RCS58135.1 EamA family transporter RarD [Parvibium lacunae]